MLDPPALRARPEVRPDHARRRRREDLAANATIPLRQALPQPVELDEFFNMFDERTRRAIQGNLDELRRRASPAAARTSTSRSATSTRCSTTSSRSCATSRAPKTDLQGFWDGARRRAPRVVAPVAEVQGEMFAQPRHDVQRARGGRRPVHPGDDRRGPADAAHGDPHAPDHPAVPRQHRGALHARSSPASRTSPAAAPDLADGRPRRHARARGLAGVQRAPGDDVQGARDVRHRPAGHARASRT